MAFGKHLCADQDINLCVRPLVPSIQQNFLYAKVKSRSMRAIRAWGKYSWICSSMRWVPWPKGLISLLAHCGQACGKQLHSHSDGSVNIRLINAQQNVPNNGDRLKSSRRIRKTSLAHNHDDLQITGFAHHGSGAEPWLRAIRAKCHLAPALRRTSTRRSAGKLAPCTARWRRK